MKSIISIPTLLLLSGAFAAPEPAPAPQLSGGGSLTCNVRSSCGSGPLPYRQTARVAGQVLGYYAPGTKLSLYCYTITEPGGCGDSKESSRGGYVPAACFEGCTGGSSGDHDTNLTGLVFVGEHLEYFINNMGRLLWSVVST
ncbi:hypothetical protein BJ166DRAFT_502668 [Pestalotiopsis sp. NC0098]|nr:hypothetical protein BJ166DRAFT_502668 [Pestalotiopsis sp. NC0098]